MPAVTYRGAADVPHCSGMVRSGHSLNVRVNGIGVSRQGDNNTPHLLPCGLLCLFNGGHMFKNILWVNLHSAPFE